MTNCIITSKKNKKDFMGTIKDQYYRHNGSALALALLPNGFFASGGEYNKIRIWDLNNEKYEKTLFGHTGCIWDLIVDDDCLISASADKTIKIWNINQGIVKRTLEGHMDTVFALKVIKNGDLASASGDKTIRIWNRKKNTNRTYRKCVVASFA